MTGALHSRLFQASAAAALAVIILGLGYLGTRGQPPTRNSPAEKLRLALPVLPHTALLHIAAAKGYFAEFLEAVRVLGIYWLMTNHPPPERHTA